LVAAVVVLLTTADRERERERQRAVVSMTDIRVLVSADAEAVKRPAVEHDLGAADLHRAYAERQTIHVVTVLNLQHETTEK